MEPSENSLESVRTTTAILGDKWTPQLLCIFAEEESVRFCRLQDMVGGINPRTLSARLLTLEQQAIIEKLPAGSSSRCDYRLTQKGRDLLPTITSMASWGIKYAPTGVSDSSQRATVS